MIKLSKDIEAEVTFLLPEEGGRKGPIFSGYRPQFYYDGHDWDASLHFQAAETLPKGKPVRVFFYFASPQYHVGKIYPGKQFQLREGAKVIANGRVLRLIDLEKSANHQHR
jgi:translation elongation factor EF-Tu-like GTPase